jgi:hypothetical protein
MSHLNKNMANSFAEQILYVNDEYLYLTDLTFKFYRLFGISREIEQILSSTVYVVIKKSL